MSNSTSSTVLLDARSKPFYGEQQGAPAIDTLEAGHKAFVYRSGKVIFNTFDKFAGGWRKTSARHSPHSILAAKLAAFLGGK